LALATPRLTQDSRCGLNVQNRGLQFVDPKITTDDGVVILRATAATEDIESIGQRGIVRDAHPGVAERHLNFWSEKNSGNRYHRNCKRACHVLSGGADRRAGHLR
jgi:hypothetical protein